MEIRFVSRTKINYVHFAIALVGFMCCFANWIVPAVFIFALLASSMTVKSILYYQIYKQFSDRKIALQQSGRKYSFADPQQLIVLKKGLSHERPAS